MALAETFTAEQLPGQYKDAIGKSIQVSSMKKVVQLIELSMKNGDRYHVVGHIQSKGTKPERWTFRAYPTGNEQGSRSSELR